jgi:hypothetical protein
VAARSRLWPDPRVKPPYGAAVIRWDHPLANQLSGLWLHNEVGGELEDLTGRVARSTTTGSPVATWKSGVRGPCLTFNGATSAGYKTLSGKTLAGLANSSVVAVGRTTAATASTSRALYIERASSGNDLYYLGVSNSGFAGGFNTNAQFFYRDTAGTLNNVTGASTVNDGVARMFAVTKIGTAAVLYLNGASEATGELTASDTCSNADSATEGGDLADTADRWQDDIFYMARWTRGLTAQEMRWLAAEPYAMLRPVVRRRYFTSTVTPILSWAPSYPAIGVQ